MARGAASKQVVEDKLREAFGKDFLGVDASTKKIYVQVPEDGEMVQVAVALTCPKSLFSSASEDSFPTGNFADPTEYKPAEMTENEMDNVRQLIKELGL